VKPFSTAGKFFSGVDATTAAALVAAASDVALVVADDEQGVIRDMAFGSDELAQEMDQRWVGKPWIETVSPDSRNKVEALLRDAAAAAPPRWRHVNHRLGKGPDVPIMYAAIKVGGGDNVIAIGRSLRPMAALQQQLVEAQQAMDREYLRLRQVETRHRLLFQVSSEAVLIIEASTHRVVEANPAALKSLRDQARRLIGRTVLDVFDAASRAPVDSMFGAVLATGRAQDLPVRLQGDGNREFFLHASLFREGRAMYFLLRLVRADKTEIPLAPEKSRALEVLDICPDSFVVTDPNGRIQYANRAFLDAVQLPTTEQARDQQLDRWLGRPGVDFNLLASQLREHGSLRLFATALHGDLGSRIDVEICAVAVPDGEEACFGFSIRETGTRKVVEQAVSRERPRTVEQLTAMVGRVPLKELVRESTDMIERLCIEAALEMTSDNRASAAEVLGLSRQSLYAKLRRHGLGDLDSNETAQALDEDDERRRD
jgi:transcriptional regulator PpsR